MTNHRMTLTVPPVSLRWFPKGIDCTDALDGDLILMDHGSLADDAIRLGQEALLLTEPELKGFTWCSHTAYVRNGPGPGVTISEMVPSGHRRRSLTDYVHHVYAVAHFDVSPEMVTNANAYDKACESLEYGWLQYPVFALDDFTGAKFACGWADTVICSNHCTMVEMGLGLFPDRPPSMVVPARMALWCDARPAPVAVAA